jgi:cell division protease FtsH
MSEFAEVVKLAFWDPAYSLPKVLEDLFPHRVRMPGLQREVLWQLVAEDEARKVSPSSDRFTLAAQLTLYKYLSGTHVVDVRRILRGLAGVQFCDCPGPKDLEKVYRHIREHTSPGSGQTVLEAGRVRGYPHLEARLRREIIFPMRLRDRLDTPEEVRQADALIPRGVILHGGPGTGKTEWAKWLAH